MHVEKSVEFQMRNNKLLVNIIPDSWLGTKLMFNQ